MNVGHTTSSRLSLDWEDQVRGNDGHMEVLGSFAVKDLYVVGYPASVMDI